MKVTVFCYFRTFSYNCSQRFLLEFVQKVLITSPLKYIESIHFLFFKKTLNFTLIFTFYLSDKLLDEYHNDEKENGCHSIFGQYLVIYKASTYVFPLDPHNHSAKQVKQLVLTVFQDESNKLKLRLWQSQDSFSSDTRHFTFPSSECLLQCFGKFHLEPSLFTGIFYPFKKKKGKHNSTGREVKRVFTATILLIDLEVRKQIQELGIANSLHDSHCSQCPLPDSDLAFASHSLL